MHDAVVQVIEGEFREVITIEFRVRECVDGSEREHPSWILLVLLSQRYHRLSKTPEGGLCIVGV